MAFRAWFFSLRPYFVQSQARKKIMQIRSSEAAQHQPRLFLCTMFIQIVGRVRTCMAAVSLITCQCLLMALCSFAQTTSDTWIDKSPHKEMLVKVNGISLEALDWGGQGETVLLLAGLGNTAHIFDNLAPQLTNHFHVFGLTRRGYGHSDKPQTGYDAKTLVEDIHQFLDVKSVKRVILVGHSFAGIELTRF